MSIQLFDKQITSYELDSSRSTKKIKERRTFLDKYIPELHSRNHAKAYLLTINILSDEFTLEEAWKIIEIKLEQTINVLKTRNDLYYILSSVETHEDKKKGNFANSAHIPTNS